MVDKILLGSLMKEREEINAQYKEFTEKCRNFDNRLCDCLGVERGTAIKEDDIIKVLLKDDCDDSTSKA